MFNFASVDFIVSIAYFLSTWPIHVDETNVVWNIGNQATCNFQGFIVQFGSAAFLYVSFLLGKAHEHAQCGN